VIEETAALEGVGDKAAHMEAATVEREASLRDSEAADRESEKARLESQRLARALQDSPQTQEAGTESAP
jgi:hypothetical protein